MDKKLFKSLLGLIIISLLCVFALWNYKTIGSMLSTLLTILRPVIIGIAIALVLNSPTVKLGSLYRKTLFKKAKKDKTKVCNILGLISSYIILLGFLSVIIFVIVPELFTSITELSSNIDGYFENFTTWLNNLLAKIDTHTPNDFQLIDEIYKVFQGLLSNADSLLKGLLGVTQGVFGVVVDIVLGLVVSVYLLSGKKRLYTQFKKICFAAFAKNTADKILDTVKLSYRTFSNFISGQLTEALILCVLCYIGMTVFGFEFALLISFIIGLTSLIPIVGAFIGTVPSAFLLLLIEPIEAVWFVIFIVVLQQIEGNLIYPHVVGHKVGLSSLWVLLAIIIGGGLGGILGMLIGVPCMSIAYELISEAVQKKLDKKNIMV